MKREGNTEKNKNQRTDNRRGEGRQIEEDGGKS